MRHTRVDMPPAGGPPKLGESGDGLRHSPSGVMASVAARMPRRRARSPSDDGCGGAKKIHRDAVMSIESMVEMLYQAGPGWKGLMGLDSVLLRVHRPDSDGDGGTRLDVLAATRTSPAEAGAASDNILAFG